VSEARRPSVSYARWTSHDVGVVVALAEVIEAGGGVELAVGVLDRLVVVQLPLGESSAR
jgi:hypothetical protein